MVRTWALLLLCVAKAAAQAGVTCASVQEQASSTFLTVIDLTSATTLVSNLGDQGPDGDNCDSSTEFSVFDCAGNVDVPPVIQLGPVGFKYDGTELDLRIEALSPFGFSQAVNPENGRTTTNRVNEGFGQINLRAFKANNIDTGVDPEVCTNALAGADIYHCTQIELLFRIVEHDPRSVPPGPYNCDPPSTNPLGTDCNCYTTTGTVCDSIESPTPVTIPMFEMAFYDFDGGYSDSPEKGCIVKGTDIGDLSDPDCDGKAHETLELVTPPVTTDGREPRLTDPALGQPLTQIFQSFVTGAAADGSDMYKFTSQHSGWR